MPGLMREKRGASVSKMYTKPTNPRSSSEFEAHLNCLLKLNWDDCVHRSYIASSDDLLGCVHCFPTSRTHIWAPWFLGKLWGVGVSCRAMRRLSVRKKNSFKKRLKGKVKCRRKGKSWIVTIFFFFAATDYLITSCFADCMLYEPKYPFELICYSCNRKTNVLFRVINKILNIWYNDQPAQR